MGEKRLSSLFDFENRERIFSEVYYRVKFCLITIGANEANARFAFFLTNPAQLEDSERNFFLTPVEIAQLNPNSRTAPVFRARADATLAAKIYSRSPVLIEDAKGPIGNPWKVEFRQGLFNLTSESGRFRTASQLAMAGFVRKEMLWVERGNRAEMHTPRPEAVDAAAYAPLYEAKMIHQFDHRWAGYDEDGENSFDSTAAETMNPGFEPAPRYWVPAIEIDTRLAEKSWSRYWLMGWRDIANTVN